MLTLGIDEVARGPIIGSMFIAGTMFDEKDLVKLKELGVKDSKLLEHSKRVELAKKIKKLAKKIKIFSVVYNGIDLRKFSFSADPKKFLTWVGRVDPYKGLGAAIQVAEKTKYRLSIAGPIQNQRYFNEEIKPKLNKNIKYYGPLSGRKLVRFYKNSKAYD